MLYIKVAPAHDRACKAKGPMRPMITARSSKLDKGLINAVKKGDLDEVKHFIKLGANVELIYRQQTLLHLASRHWHEEVVDYLASHYPNLLYIPDKQGLLPSELRRKKHDKSAAFFQENYSNEFFGAIKKIIPEEIIFLIALQLNPLSYASLLLMNKAWYRILNDKQVVSYQAQRVKKMLPEKFQNESWLKIFDHYYSPQLPKASFLTEMEAFHCFIENIQHVYIMVDALPLRHINISSASSASIPSLGFFSRVKNKFLLKKQYKELNGDLPELEKPAHGKGDLECHIQSFVQRWLLSNQAGLGYRTLGGEAEEELKIVGYPNYYARKPFVAIKIKLSAALSHLHAYDSFIVYPADFVKIKYWSYCPMVSELPANSYSLMRR